MKEELEGVSDELFYYRSKRTIIDKVFNRVIKIDRSLMPLIKSHKKRSFDLVLANTVVTAPVLNLLLKSVSTKSILWIHDYDYSINDFINL